MGLSSGASALVSPRVWEGAEPGLPGQVERIGPWDLANRAELPVCPPLAAGWGRGGPVSRPLTPTSSSAEGGVSGSCCDVLSTVLPQETPSLLLLRDARGPPPALLFSCQTGVGRTNLGMVLGTLVLFHRSGTASGPE